MSRCYIGTGVLMPKGSGKLPTPKAVEPIEERKVEPKPVRQKPKFILSGIAREVSS